jgi:hypothetical protein
VEELMVVVVEAKGSNTNSNGYVIISTSSISGSSKIFSSANDGIISGCVLGGFFLFSILSACLQTTCLHNK